MGLTDKQSEYSGEVAMSVAEGMEGKEIVRLRKELQRPKNNAQNNNGDYQTHCRLWSTPLTT